MRNAKLSIFLACSLLALCIAPLDQRYSQVQAQTAVNGFQTQWVSVQLSRDGSDHLNVGDDSCPAGWTATKLYDAYSKEEQDIGRSNLWHTGEEEAAFSDTAQSPSGLKHLCVKANDPEVTIVSAWGAQGCPAGMGYPIVYDDSGTYTSNTEDRIPDLPSLHATNEGSFKGTHNYYVWCMGAQGDPGVTPKLQLRWASVSSTNPASVPSCAADEVALLHSSKRQYNLNYGDFYGTPQETLCGKLTVLKGPVPTATLVANPTRINVGESSTLTWSSANTTSCTGTNFSTGGATSGSLQVSPGVTTQYSVSCTGPGGDASAAARVAVITGSDLNGSCSVSPASIDVGGSATWTVSASGASGSYTYEWSGTDDLTGTGTSVTKTYTTPGTKTGSVTITSTLPTTGGGGGTTDPGAGDPGDGGGGTGTVDPGDGGGGGGTLDPGDGGGGGGFFNLLNFIPTAHAYYEYDTIVSGDGDGGGGGGDWGGIIEDPYWGAETSVTIDCSNELTVTGPQPDLTAGTVSPTSAVAGQPVTLSAVATNIGNAVSGSFPLLFQVQSPESLENSAYLAALAAAGTGSGSVSHTFDTAGTYQVRACANFNTSWTAITTESNYGNNCGNWTTVTVSGVAAPPTGGTLSCTVSPSSVSAGGSATYTATGGTAPYTWTPSDTGTPSTTNPPTTTRIFSANGTYGMQVSSADGQTAQCLPYVTVGVSSCGTASTTITATPNRVRADNNTGVSLSFSATGVDGSCTITGPGVSQTIPGNACIVGSQSIQTPQITQQSIYRISCDNEATAEAIVNIIPRFQEF
jgi:hypothetical protein